MFLITLRHLEAGAVSSVDIVRSTWRAEGIGGFYRGYLTTVAREIPFSLIQFPLWEALKSKWAEVTGRQPQPW